MLCIEFIPFIFARCQFADFLNLPVQAFAFTVRTAVRLKLIRRIALTPSVRELVFRAQGRFRFAAGQYLELEVPHPHPDARGTRREFSIVSAPEDLPEVRDWVWADVGETGTEQGGPNATQLTGGDND